MRTAHDGGLLFLLPLCLSLLAMPAARAQPSTFTGVVLGPDDRPVAGTRVIVLDPRLNARLEAASKPVEVLSDAAGSFSAIVPAAGPRDARPVLALKPGFALTWRWGAPSTPLTLSLGVNPLTRAGRVLAPDGKPIAGATVFPRALIMRSPTAMAFIPLGPQGPLSARSDEQGKFSFEGLPSEVALSLTASADGCATVSVQSETEAAGEIIITLPPEATIAGRVTHDGQGVGGVSVFCQPNDVNPDCTGWDSQLSAADGSYTLRHLPPGTYNVLLDPPAGLAGKAVEGLVLRVGAHATGADFVMSRGALVRGTVTDEKTGKPVARVPIAAYGPARPESSACCQSTMSAADGSYELRLPAGKNMVYYQGSGYAVVGDNQRRIELQEGQTATSDFVLRPPDKISGQVLDPEGKPALQAEVVFLNQPGMPGWPLEVAADGKFEIIRPTAEPPGGGGLPVLALDKRRGLAGMVRVGPQTAAVSVRMQPAGFLGATVLDAAGKPVPGVLFPVSLPGEPGAWEYAIAEARTDRQGQARIGPLPPGVPLKIVPESRAINFAADAGWWDKVGPVTLQPGEERKLPPLILDLDGRRLKLCVLDEQQHSVAGALVFASGPYREATATDAHGQLELKGLPLHGKITLIAMHPTLPLFATATVDPDWNFWPGLVLQPLCRVSGRVLDGAGKPVAGAAVMIEDPFTYAWVRGDSILAQRLRAAGAYSPATTDANGVWRADFWIEDMDYRIYARAPGGMIAPADHFTAQGGPAPQEVGPLTVAPQQSRPPEP